MTDHRFEERGTSVDRRRDSDARGFEQPDQTCPEEVLVFGEDNSHGISKVATVGPPEGLVISSVPSKLAIRRWTPRSPVPCAASTPPKPWSVIVTRSRLPSWLAVRAASTAVLVLASMALSLGSR
jgi:hypothetical protein